MADWNQPTNTSTYTGVLATLNEKIADAAKMDFTGDTNLPVGVKRHDSSTRKFQEWNGTSWVDISVHFGGDLGIGNTSPSSYSFNGSPLLAVGSSSTNGTVSIVSSTTGLGCLAFADGTSGVDRYRGLIEYSHASNFLRFFVDGAERIRINSSGSLGVGTGDPSQRLHVSDGTSTGDVRALVGDGTNNVQLIRNGTTDGWIRFTGIDGIVDVANTKALILRTNSVERMRIDSGGSVGIGLIPSGSVRLQVRSAGTTNTTYPVRCENSAGTVLFEILSDGGFFTGTAGSSPFNLTTGNAANVNVASSGVLSRSTSSMKYKEDVQDLSYGLSKVLQTRPVSFAMKGGEAAKRFAGLIAEDIDALGMPEFVQYADDGSPDALNYANMVALAFNAIKELNAKMESLEAQLGA
jgi:hypothetical protein